MSDFKGSNREEKNKVYYVPVISENGNILAYKKVNMEEELEVGKE